MIQSTVRVALVAGQLGIGGTERQIHGLVEHLNCKEVQTLVVCMTSSAHPFGDWIKKLGIPCTILDHKHLSTADRVRALIQVLHLWQADLAHSFGDSAGAFAEIATTRLGIPHIHSVRSHFTGRGILKCALRAFVCRSADLVTANSTALRTSIIRSLALPPSRVLLTPNGIDRKRFENINPNCVSRCVCNSKRPIVLYVGRNHPSKDIPTLLETIRRIDRLDRGAMSQPCFVLVGRGMNKCARSLDSDISSVKLYFPGEVYEIEPWLIASDLLILTSRSEGMPNVVLEAMAAARPVVATAVGGCLEAVKDGYTGRLVKPRDARAMVRGVEELLSDLSMRRTMGERGREHVINHYNWERSCQSVKTAYRRSVDRKRRRAIWIPAFLMLLKRYLHLGPA